MADREQRSVIVRDPFFVDLFEGAPAFPRVYSRDFFDTFWGRPETAKQFPVIDVCEDDARYVVTAELPGVSRQHIRVDIHDGHLTLHGRRDARVACEQYHQVERGHGEFSRTFRLPNDVSAGDVSAELKDGVLTVIVPKLAGHAPRRVDVG